MWHMLLSEYNWYANIIRCNSHMAYNAYEWVPATQVAFTAGVMCNPVFEM